MGEREMDERVIHESGVVRMTLRQLCNLWMDAEEKCSGATDLIDVSQPDNFNGDVSFSLFEQGDTK